VPDTNILLHLFRYGDKTRAQVIDTLSRLQPRLWIPYRAGLEFQRSWRDVDQSNRDAYDKLIKDIESEGARLASLFDEYTRHQIIDAESEKKKINEFIKHVCDGLSACKAKHPSRADADKIFNTISDLVGDNVGSQPSDQVLEDQMKEGQKRYDALVPPGYRDAKKRIPDRYGDFFIWKEVLEKAKDEKKPVIMITDDIKMTGGLNFTERRSALGQS
jgi:hypothetical protein